ncbi:MAG: WD40 repeat domain-containing protein [Gemmataceae bacterium]
MPARSPRVCPEGRKLIVWGEGEVSLWDLANDNRLETSSARNTKKAWMRGVAFSSDGKRLASASNDRTMRLWDVELGEEILALPSRDLPLTSVAMDESGEHLATCVFGVNWRTREPGVTEVRLWAALRKN